MGKLHDCTFALTSSSLSIYTYMDVDERFLPLHLHDVFVKNHIHKQH